MGLGGRVLFRDASAACPNGRCWGRFTHIHARAVPYETARSTRHGPEAGYEPRGFPAGPSPACGCLQNEDAGAADPRGTEAGCSRQQARRGDAAERRGRFFCRPKRGATPGPSAREQPRSRESGVCSLNLYYPAAPSPVRRAAVQFCAPDTKTYKKYFSRKWKTLTKRF